MLSIKSLFSIRSWDNEKEKLSLTHQYDFTEEQKDAIVRIFREKKDQGTEQMESNSKVFVLKRAPEFVFKNFGSKTADHYERVHQVAKRICFENKLDLLVVPKSALLDIDGTPFIVEEYLNIYHDGECQKHLFYQLSNQLTKTMRQLAIFIAKMGFNDVTERNIPILNDGSRPPRICLIDPGRHGSKVSKGIREGFFGSLNGSCGLIKCATSSDQIDAIFSVMKSEGVCVEHNIEDASLQKCKSTRLESLKWYNGIDEYYARKQFRTGKEPIECSINSLDLDLTARGTYYTLGKFFSKEAICKEEWENSWLGWLWLMITRRKKSNIEHSPGFHGYTEGTVGNEVLKFETTLPIIAQEFIDVINRLIEEQPENKSIRGKRSIQLFHGVGPHPDFFHKYKNLGRDTFIFDGKLHDSMWIVRILKSLVDKGHIFNYSFNNSTLHIQA